MFQEGLFPDPHCLRSGGEGEAKTPPPSIKTSSDGSITCSHHLLFRRRSCISGSSPRYAWRVLVELSRCLRVETESPAPHVTLVSTTMTRQPAPPAPLGPIPMGQNVLRTRICIEQQLYLYSLLNQLNSNCVFSLCSSNSMFTVSCRH